MKMLEQTSLELHILRLEWAMDQEDKRCARHRMYVHVASWLSKKFNNEKWAGLYKYIYNWYTKHLYAYDPRCVLHACLMLQWKIAKLKLLNIVRKDIGLAPTDIYGYTYKVYPEPAVRKLPEHS